MPTSIPSAVPSVGPSDSPTVSASGMPSSIPSTVPTSSPSGYPSVTPSDMPTSIPSVVPSVGPSDFPSVSVSLSPSNIPTIAPSVAPSYRPSNTPTTLPSQIPTTSIIPSTIPSIMPTMALTDTSSVSVVPSTAPTDIPSVSAIPSTNPTQTPSVSFIPSTSPSESPVGTGSNICIAPADLSGSDIIDDTIPYSWSIAYSCQLRTEDVNGVIIETSYLNTRYYNDLLGTAYNFETPVLADGTFDYAAQRTGDREAIPANYIWPSEVVRQQFVITVPTPFSQMSPYLGPIYEYLNVQNAVPGVELTPGADTQEFGYPVPQVSLEIWEAGFPGTEGPDSAKAGVAVTLAKYTVNRVASSETENFYFTWPPINQAIDNGVTLANLFFTAHSWNQGLVPFIDETSHQEVMAGQLCAGTVVRCTSSYTANDLSNWIATYQ